MTIFIYSKCRLTFILWSKMKLKDIVRSPGDKVYARCLDKSGRKHFLSASYDEMWTIMCKSKHRCYSEVIEDSPCHMFFDIDGANDVDECWTNIEPYVNDVLDALGLKYKHVKLDSSDSTKQSMHIITQCDYWLLGSPSEGLGFLQMLKSVHPQIDLSFVDLLVYNRNRCFRMLGSSKFGSTRKLVGEWNKDSWINSLVQPTCDRQVKHRWGSTDAVVGMYHGKHPECVAEALKWIGAVDVRRYPLSWTYVGNLKKQVCPFAHRQHRNNNLRFVLRLGTALQIKCHKCDGIIRKTLPMQNNIDLFLNSVVQ